ncbi:unnamed protein product, partial [Scytosiphon promiscuus]
MFAQSGGGGGDDPYNFEIADGFGGGASKRNSKKSKLGKSFLHKTTGASVGASPLTPKGSSRATTKLNLAVDSKEPLRASAPAAPTSALDKAMNFLNKYSSSTAPNKTGAERTFRQSSGAPIPTFNEDELDLSLSSDSDAGDWKPARKALTGRKVSPDKLTPEPRGETKSRALTGMRTSARFSTAKELGISEKGELSMPKAAVSPLGLMKSSTNRITEGAKPNEADGNSPSESHLSGLRLAVDILGNSSPNTDLLQSGSASDVDSIVSALVETVVDEIQGGAEGFENGARPSPTFQQDSESARTSKQDDREARDKELARAPVDRGSLGNVASFHDLAAISGHDNPSNCNNSQANAKGNQIQGRAGSIDNNGSHATDNGGRVDSEQALTKTALVSAEIAGSACVENVVSRPSVPGQGESPASTTQATAGTSGDNTWREVAKSAIESRVGRQKTCTGEADGMGQRDTPQEPREAWAMAVVNEEKANLAPVTIDSGTSPEPRINPDADWKNKSSPENTRGIEGESPSALKEAWGHASAAGPSINGQTRNSSVAEGRADDCHAGQTLPPKAARCPRRGGDAACEPGRREGRIGSVTKRGIVMDRSSEARDYTRPSGEKVKVVVRADAVSSVEYAHDPERQLELRSCGTQMAGNSAAVQANIAVPGMAGTTSHIDCAFVPQGTRTAGVGYGQGEAYAKWGRFACEVPLYTRSGVSARRSASVDQLRRPPRSAREDEPGDNMGRGNDDALLSGSSGSDEIESTGDRGNAGVTESCQAGDKSNAAKMAQVPPARGGPAYFETFSNIMEKYHEETCPWQQMLEEAALPRRTSAPSGDCDHLEGEAETAHVAENMQPGIRDAAREQMQGCFGGARDIDVALHGILTATQDSFRTQLADMRESLNKIRYRAETAGRRGQVHRYESLTDTRDFLARARPKATSQVDALRTVDPSLSVDEAEAV